jgi:soluble lytic murein transglycosylase
MSLSLYERALLDEGLEPPDRRRADFGRADCLFASRRYEEAIGAYEKLVGEETGQRRFHARMKLARSHARNGDKKLALRQLDKIAGEAGPATRARAQYLSALLVGPPGSKAEREQLRRVEKQRAVPALARLARWRLAWSDFGAGEYAEAGRRLRQLAKGELFDVEVQRALYWLAATELEQDRREEGRALLRRIVEGLPLSYYGFLAAERLGEPVSPTRSFLPSREGKTEDRAAKRAAWLHEGGFPELARLELESRLRAPALDLELRTTLAQLLRAIGDHFDALRVAVDGVGDALERGIDPAWQEVWELAWPRPYPETVKRATREFGAEWALVYAVMREESRYRPDAVSPVGARGLMQILPPTGEKIAEDLGVSDFDVGRLFQPETNIRFGSYYLRQLLRRFNGRWPLAIAAYNAGPEVVASWAEERGSASRDVFVDSIPYAETRRYLRRVLRSRWVYELLYGGEKVAGVPPQPEVPIGR